MSFLMIKIIYYFLINYLLVIKMEEVVAPNLQVNLQFLQKISHQPSFN